MRHKAAKETQAANETQSVNNTQSRVVHASGSRGNWNSGNTSASGSRVNCSANE